MYGIQNGSTSFQGNQYEVVTNKSEVPKKTQEQLAAQMGISVDTLQNYKLLSERTPKVSDSLNQEQLDILSSTGFQYVTFCHVLKQLSHCMEKTITGYRHSQRKLCRYSS